MAGRPQLSVVVVTHGHARELPRTLQSLLPPYQHEVPGGTEVIVVDNGSAVPVRDALPSTLAAAVSIHRISDGAASPAGAANAAIRQAQGELIGLIIDGARLASPALLSSAALASRLHPAAVITAPAWHLGPDLQVRSAQAGYDEHAEDELLASSRWESDGYQLFTISTPAASSQRGLFGPMGESSSLFLRSSQWEALGGLDERFALPGGGMVNHDLYRRACALDGAQLVVLLGEGTFHQMHGGAATSGRVSRDAMREEYERLVGAEHRPPGNRPIFVGAVPPQYLAYLQHSAALAAPISGQDGSTTRGTMQDPTHPTPTSGEGL